MIRRVRPPKSLDTLAITEKRGNDIERFERLLSDSGDSPLDSPLESPTGYQVPRFVLKRNLLDV